MDTELESQIENLRDTQRKYGNVLRLARALTSHFYHVIQTQVSTYLFGRDDWNSHPSRVLSTSLPFYQFAINLAIDYAVC